MATSQSSIIGTPITVRHQSSSDVPHRSTVLKKCPIRVLDHSIPSEISPGCTQTSIMLKNIRLEYLITVPLWSGQSTWSQSSSDVHHKSTVLRSTRSEYRFTVSNLSIVTQYNHQLTMTRYYFLAQHVFRASHASGRVISTNTIIHHRMNESMRWNCRITSRSTIIHKRMVNDVLYVVKHGNEYKAAVWSFWGSAKSIPISTWR